MSLRSPLGMKMEHVLGLTAVFPQVRHSRMLLAGIQADPDWTPD